MKKIPRLKNQFPVGTTKQNYCASTSGIGFGHIDGNTYINAEFKDKKSLLNWCNHELFLLQSVVERLKYFIADMESQNEGTKK